MENPKYEQMKFLLILLLFFVVQGVCSQENNSVRYGIKAGANFSHINFSKSSSPPDHAISTNWQPGIVAGFVVVVPVFNDIFFQPEYLFSQMGGKFEEENKQYQINYLSLPAFLRWNFYEGFSLLIGPQFDLLINSKEKAENIETSLDDNIEHRSIFITGGLEYFFTNNLILGMKYMHGLNPVDIQRDNDNQEFKYQGFQFFFTYLF